MSETFFSVCCKYLEHHAIVSLFSDDLKSVSDLPKLADADGWFFLGTSGKEQSQKTVLILLNPTNKENMMILLEFNNQCKYEMTWSPESATLGDANANIEAVDCTGISHWVVVVNTDDNLSINIHCETKLKFKLPSFDHLSCTVSIDEHLLTGFHFDSSYRKVRYSVTEISQNEGK